MFYLILAILGSSMISILLRISSGKIKEGCSMLTFNYLACTVLGVAYAGFDPGIVHNPGFPRALGLGIFNGILLLGGFILMQSNVRKNGVVLTSIFTKLGLLVPVILSVVLFREMPTAVQIVGFVMAVAAIILINLRRDTGSFDWSLILLLLVCGSTDAMAKIYEVFGHADLTDPYLLYSFGAAFVLSIGVVFAGKERPGFREFLFGTLIGIPNFLSSKFLLAALKTVPAVVAYPTFSVATLLVITLAGVLAFREKLRNYQWAALGAILIALVMLNV